MSGLDTGLANAGRGPHRPACRTGPIDLGKLTGQADAAPRRFVRHQGIGKQYFSSPFVDQVPVPVQLGLELLDEPTHGSAVHGDRLPGFYLTGVHAGSVGRRGCCGPNADATPVQLLLRQPSSPGLTFPGLGRPVSERDSRPGHHMRLDGGSAHVDLDIAGGPDRDRPRVPPVAHPIDPHCQRPGCRMFVVETEWLARGSKN